MSDGDGNPRTRGNSYANGPVVPPWARAWEFRLMREAAFDRWTVQA
jgi:hypothetical protein